MSPTYTSQKCDEICFHKIHSLVPWEVGWGPSWQPERRPLRDLWRTCLGRGDVYVSVNNMRYKQSEILIVTEG